MCGIVGALNFNEAPVTNEYIVKMRDAMIHRGPDGAGVWCDGHVGFGHRRLSIIDLSEHASQPMLSSDGRYCLTYNGEIYNHQSIRNELIKLGVTDWQTDHSDTEVILKSFAHWGIDCVHKFRGMFAFGIWDKQEHLLWLVRDRIGVKPLYYSRHNNRITFASEIKALLQDPKQHRAVNEAALYHYLSFLTTPAPETLFDGIQKLQPGTWLRVNAKTAELKSHRYWDVLDHVDIIQEQDEKAISKRIITELRDAVALRQVSDVPVGVFLSGGIDSSTNAALFSEKSITPVDTYSIGYQGEYKTYKNELHFAKEVADFVGANYHERLLTVDDLLDFLPEMIHLQDEPIADPVCIPVYYVSKLARDNGTIVCQVGEGADELFWGYPSWKIKHNLQRLNDIPFTGALKKSALYALKKFGKEQSLPFELLRRGCADVPVFWGGAEAFTESQKKQLLSPRLRQQFDTLSSWDVLQPIWQNYQEKAPEKSILNWMSYLDLNYRLPELLLMRVDKMSMGVSLEGRVPFLDHKFVELAMSIPSSMKTKNGNLKHLLKQSVRGVIPDNIIDRPKQGFGVPVYEWFFDKLGTKTRTVLTEFCDETDYFDKQAVLNMLNQGAGAQVWYLLNFALWWQHYIR